MWHIAFKKRLALIFMLSFLTLAMFGYENWISDKYFILDSIKPVLDDREIKIQNFRDPLVEDALQELLDGPPMLRHFESNLELESFNLYHICLPLACWKKLSTICVHNFTEDVYVSVQIARSGCWERDIVFKAMNVLTSYREINVLDLGCNIGTFTITAAAHGFRVVGVDPVKKNLKLLSKSLRLGRLEKNVSLFWNAVSDQRDIIVLTDEAGNVGGTSIKSFNNSSINLVGIDEDHIAYSVLLDDFISIFNDKPVFIKMDIEGSEFKALLGGQKFFREKDVQYVLLEWFQHKGKLSGDGIIKFLSGMSFAPFSLFSFRRRLDIAKNLTWPDNVLWKKSAAVNSTPVF